MSLPFGQHEGLREPTPLPEILGGTAFVSASGRIYRLFGNEEEKFTLPTIPSIPPFLLSTKAPALALEEALHQIDTYSSLAESQSKNRGVKSGDCAALHPRLLVLPIPANDLLDEVSNVAPKPREERRKNLRVVFGPCEEPFIVPFSKPESLSEETEKKNTTLKVVEEFVPPSLLSIRMFRRYWQHRRKKQIPYRKPFLLLPSESPSEPQSEDCVVSSRPSGRGSEVPHDSVVPMTFQWSALLDSLKQTADNQIRMLTDHLVVQSSQGVKEICFKGVFPEDGCSTVLLCAVRALTERRLRVLLIDAHHQNIDLPRQLNLSGGADAGNKVITLNEHLSLWVWQKSRTVEENTARLAEVMTTYRNDYDLVLLDCGSLTERPLAEFAVWWKQIEPDGVVLVTNMKQPQEISMSHIADRLRQHQIHLIGIIENHV